MVVAALLGLIALPLVFLFDLENLFLEWMSPETSQIPPGQLGWLAFVLLAADIFLPVPSSGVATVAGALLGIFPAILICFLGMTMSVVIGYWSARFLGIPFAKRLAKASDLEPIHEWFNHYGFPVLILLRGIPVIGEASVLVSGAYRLSFPRVLLSTSLANLALVSVYVLLGHFAGESEWLTTAVLVAVIAPLFALFYVRVLIQKNGKSPTN